MSDRVTLQHVDVISYAPTNIFLNLFKAGSLSSFKSP